MKTVRQELEGSEGIEGRRGEGREEDVEMEKRSERCGLGKVFHYRGETGRGHLGWDVLGIKHLKSAGIYTKLNLLSIRCSRLHYQKLYFKKN